MRIIFLTLSIIAIVGGSISWDAGFKDGNDHQSIIDDFEKRLKRDLINDNIGGIYCSPNDLGKFMISNLGYSEIINKNNLAIMQRKQTPGEERWQNYGLGFFLYQDDVISTVGHGGSVSGYTADFLFEKQSQYGVILMRNYNWGSTNLNSQAVNLLRKLREFDLEQGK